LPEPFLQKAKAPGAGVDRDFGCKRFACSHESSCSANLKLEINYMENQRDFCLLRDSINAVAIPSR
jgi:hypothetical protein